MRLYLVASKPTDSVTYGFLPAARQLGLDVTVFTDRPDAHRRCYAGRPPGSGPALGVAGPGDYPPPRIVPCPVFDSRLLIEAMTAAPAPDAVASNSDRLQAETALAAAYLGLPGKDWRSALRAKQKLLMRRRLARAGVEDVRVAVIRSGTGIRGDTGPLDPDGLVYPVVLKPEDGVASEDVVLVTGPSELARRCAAFFARYPDRTLLAEEFLPGSLRTMETLGDGVTRWVLGGFRTTVSPPPYFTEERLVWDPPDPAAGHVPAALDALGVSFGACHTEYVDGPACRLIEVNDRLIGDHCDFLLAHLLGLPLFELVLRIHLGERLPPVAPAAPPGRAHAVADYVTADRGGLLAAAPPAAGHDLGGPDVALAYWPMRPPGEYLAVSGSNRDYLGVICAVGPDEAAVAQAASQLRGRLRWDIRDQPARVGQP
jgi:hypothetical protein